MSNRGGVRKLGGGLDPKASKTLYTRKDGGDVVWRNEASQVLEMVTAYVPYTILCAMRSLERKVARPGLEYGLYLKGEYNSGVLEVSEEFMIPRQIVTGSTIDFIEDDANQFNGVIHRHPMNLKRFSGTDKESINQNYEFSLLYVDRDIPHGIINLDVADGFGKVQLELEIEIEFPMINLDQAEIDEKIIVRTPPRQLAPQGRKTTNYGLYKPSPPLPKPQNGGVKRFDNEFAPIQNGLDLSDLNLPEDGQTDDDIELDAQAYLAYLKDRDPDDHTPEDDEGFLFQGMGHFARDI